MSGFNPRTPWSELERRLSATKPDPAASSPVGAGWPSASSAEPAPASLAPAVRTAPHSVRYAELHAHSVFSFLDGASQPDELIAEAARAGLSAMALTDHNSLGGAVQFAQAAREHEVPTVFGAELSLGLREKIPGQIDPEAHHLQVLAVGVEGYRQLSAAITRANMRGEKNRPVFELEELAALDADWKILTGCRKGHLGRALNDPDGGAVALRRLVDLFGRDRVVVELTRFGLPGDDARIAHLQDLAARFRLPAAATNAVHYADRTGFHDAQVRASIRSRLPLSQLAGWLPPTASARIHTPAEMLARFGQGPVTTAAAIGEECAFELRAARAGLPSPPVPAGRTDAEHLRDLVIQGARKRYGSPEQAPRAWEQIHSELDVIDSMGLAGYFLIVEDIARFCRENNIFCQGRGSAANSAVCFVLGVTAVDAVQFQLLFDRFLSPERAGYPDIDLDIESSRREEVIQYTYRTYGRDRAAQVANYITYRPRSAIRDAAHALGYSPGQQDAFTKGVNRWRSLPPTDESPAPSQVLQLAEGLLGTPRHLGIHSGGMVLADRPLGEVVPIEQASMPGRTVLQWDKDDCAAMDLVKFDLLGLGMLGALHEMVDLVAQHTGVRIDRAQIPQEDGVYDMLCRADALGVFQVESRAQLATLPRLKPRNFYDLAVQVALIRPGPIQGGSVHPYIRRRQGLEDVDYIHPSTRPALEKTLGVPLFQEQLMQLAIDVAGFSGTDADELRRAMGASRSQRKMRELQQRFHSGCKRRGIDEQTAQVIFDKIAAFANYGFPESHALSFAGLVYESAWFKYRHHAAFTAGLLRSQPMGFYSSQSLISDARRHGIAIRPVHINSSGARTDLEADAESSGGFAIRLGLDEVKGVADAASALERERQAGEYTSIVDVAERTGVGVRVLEALATAGAFDCFEVDRRQALWTAGALGRAGPQTLPGTAPAAQPPTLPAMDDFDVTLAQLFSTGITVEGYPTEHLRAQLTARGCWSTADVQNAAQGQRVTVAGIVTHRQRPSTSQGITFINLEDEFGMLNIVCTRGLIRRFSPHALTRSAIVVTGLIQRAGSVVSLYAHSIVPLEVDVPIRSRDFR